MKSFKSLSDSSTSESEDDFGKRCPQLVSREPWGATKRSHSTDDTEDENVQSCRMPVKYVEKPSTDEDDPYDFFESSAKKIKTSFKNPTQYVERNLSDSESDDRNSSHRITSNSKNSSKEDTVNGVSYGMGAKLLEKMGYKAGTGLGKNSQGRVEIIEASKQRGRRGLGLHIVGLESSDDKWDFTKDDISIQEEVDWMPESNDEVLHLSQLRNWIVEDTKKMTIDDETEFCDPKVLQDVLHFKSVFDELEPEEMRKARTRSNPFETIRGGIFLNRAAMKMANIDYAFDFMFTNPKTKYDEPVISKNELLYFADICAGPGGFSEYVLWRKKWESKGFGFTLKGPNDFKLEDFFAGPPETFEPVYGVTEDGDIYVPANIIDFKKYVFSNTEGKGVHFVMADGGFSVEGKENIQEILSKRLYLCQFLCALSILRVGGHFVCKLFDLFTPFSVGLVYLMYKAFEKICIFKPNTSRPANSERYIVCKWRKENTRDICDYMYEINCHIDGMSRNSELDIREIVPLNILKNDSEFCNYIFNSNNALGLKQAIHLDKIRVFAKNVKLHDERQNDLKKECLALWKVPDQARLAPPTPDPKAQFDKLMKGKKNFLSDAPELLTVKTLSKLKPVFDFQCVVSGASKTDQPASFFLGLGKSCIYRYEVKNRNWEKIKDTLELPADTLFYGELVFELKGENQAQKKIMCLHIIDAICLGGKDVRNKHFKDRMMLAEKLAKAVSKPSKKNHIPLRVKTVFELHQIDDIFERLAMKFTKNSHQVPRLCFDLEEGRHILPTGLLLFKTVVDPWVVAFSKTHQRTYFFNTKNRASIYEVNEEASAEFQQCFSKSLLWNWESGVKLLPEQNIESKNSVLHGNTVINFVHENLKKLTGRV